MQMPVAGPQHQPVGRAIVKRAEDLPGDLTAGAKTADISIKRGPKLVGEVDVILCCDDGSAQLASLLREKPGTSPGLNMSFVVTDQGRTPAPRSSDWLPL